MSACKIPQEYDPKYDIMDTERAIKRITHRDAGDLQAGAGAGGELGALLAQEPDDLGANGTGAQDADAQYRCGVGMGGDLRVLLSHGEPPWRMRHVEERRRRGPA